MKYISAQPASLYYGWQIDVMLHSFVGQGVNLSDVPHILKKHFEIHKELRDETLLYHDCDIALARPLNTVLFESDAICYMSDTRSYIGSSYILS